MGVLNVTPDSFSDGGRYLDSKKAVDRALQMVEAGADIIDVGGESTRPGASDVPMAEELRRVMPVVRELTTRLSVPISIDTRKAAVAEKALDNGAAIVNDVSGLCFDLSTAPIVAKFKAAVVVMHMRGTPATMMRLARYHNVVQEVSAFLKARAEAALEAGVARSRVIVDPGIGFAKTVRHNLELLNGLPTLCGLGYPILVGVSRKNFVRKISGSGENELLFGTAAAVTWALSRGASIVRVHDPERMAPVVRIVASLARTVISSPRGLPG